MTKTGLSMALIVTLLAPLAAAPAAGQAPAPPGQVQAEPPAAASEPSQADPGKVPYQRIEVTDAHRAGAAALNVIYVPGKAITCGAGIGVAALVMLATFGSQYPYAVRFFEEGCGYPWYLRPEHVAGRDPKDER
jgi:hypothetical protein